MIRRDKKCKHVRFEDENSVSPECLTREHVHCQYLHYNEDCEGVFEEYSNTECFVATACYGEYDYITESLRVWRDRMIKEQDDRAVKFIDFYYSGFGYSTAKILRKVPTLKIVARWSILLFKKVVGA